MLNSVLSQERGSIALSLNRILLKSKVQFASFVIQEKLLSECVRYVVLYILLYLCGLIVCSINISRAWPTDWLRGPHLRPTVYGSTSSFGSAVESYKYWGLLYWWLIWLFSLGSGWKNESYKILWSLILLARLVQQWMANEPNEQSRQ